MDSFRYEHILLTILKFIICSTYLYIVVESKQLFIEQ